MVTSDSIGARLYARTYGEGPALVILHGFLGSSGNWHTLASQVFADHFSVYALDLRNHGQSPHDDAFDYQVMASDLLAFLDAQGLESAHILGHSMGGKVAMQFALTHADRTSRLLVADIAPRAYPPAHQELLDALRSVDLTSVNSRNEVDDALATRISDRPVRQFLLKNLSYDSDSKTYSWAANLPVLDALYDSVNDAIEASATFTGPTLFVRGGRSSYIQESDKTEIRSLFPNARFETIADAGHWVHAESPERFGEVALEFFLATE